MLRQLHVLCCPRVDQQPNDAANPVQDYKSHAENIQAPTQLWMWHKELFQCAVANYVFLHSSFTFGICQSSYERDAAWSSLGLNCIGEISSPVTVMSVSISLNPADTRMLQCHPLQQYCSIIKKNPSFCDCLLAWLSVNWIGLPPPSFWLRKPQNWSNQQSIGKGGTQ